ncbi:MAG TPA: ATP-binding cassette domain-containing protein [Longimicrobiales bacterium]|jgi:ABC-type multidrug transport system ATPase subunit
MGSLAGIGDPPLLVADSIGRSFGSNQVLKSATLWAWPGRITALMGRNGCGKSTLLKVAAGRLAAHSGAVRFAGTVHLRPRLHVLARDGLMYVPQEGLLVRDGWVDDHVRLFAQDGHPRLDGWITRCRLDAFLGRPVAELSTGERNRTSLALALLREPACLLADEPLTGAAPLDRELIRSVLMELRAQGCALVVTGHEARDLLDLADHVVWLVAGTTHDLGEAARAARHPQFVREYLGPDFYEGGGST